MTFKPEAFKPDLGPVSPALRALLAPKGVLRSGTNLSNFLLVTGKTETGDPVGAVTRVPCAHATRCQTQPWWRRSSRITAATPAAEASLSVFQLRGAMKLTP